MAMATDMKSTVTQEEINRFKMPRIAQGATVSFHPKGRRTGEKPQVAIVMACFDRTVSLVVPTTGMRYDAVRFIDDPKLAMNAHQRENGAWEFTEDFQQRAAETQEVLEKLARLEKTVTALVSDKAKGK